MQQGPTHAQKPAPCLVLVGFSTATVQQMTAAARLAAPCRVAACTIDDVATVVAERRPFAMVVLTSVFDFDPSEFRALARDVKSRLIKMPNEHVTDDWLKKHLVPVLIDAFCNHEDN